MTLIWLTGFVFITFFSFSSQAFELPKELSSLKQSYQEEWPATKLSIETTPEQSMRKKILRHYQQWRGTRYLYGGESRSGIDCSALMRHLFKDIANHLLPRTTGEQIRKGKSVGRGELRIGDLVFFRTGTPARHVGVYIGNGEFIHASTSKGVTVSEMSNAYWKQRYETARRIV